MEDAAVEQGYVDLVVEEEQGYVDPVVEEQEDFVDVAEDRAFQFISLNQHQLLFIMSNLQFMSNHHNQL